MHDSCQQRTQTAVEPNLFKTQYGFRPTRCTAHATHIIRRLQDKAEASGNQNCVWLPLTGKTFDELQHVTLLLALNVAYATKYRT